MSEREWSATFRRRYGLSPRPIEQTSRSRRRFLAAGTTSLLGGIVYLRELLSPSRLLDHSGNTWMAGGGRRPIRPPTADLDEDAFRAQCVRCGLCGTVCENGCIRFFGLTEAKWGMLTPYLDVRRRSCTLCMRCTEICPTDALRTVSPELEVIAEEVDMGQAVVDSDRCLSYLGRICGYCHDACPIPDKALRLVPKGKPVVLDGCVGCGRCVEFCPQSPTAIDVVREMA